jgi:hypothetical protein
VLLRIIDLDLLDRQRLIGTMKYGGLHCHDLLFQRRGRNLINATFDRALANQRTGQSDFSDIRQISSFAQ